MYVGIQFDWDDAGEVGLFPSGKLAFPQLAPEPGIYRFRVPHTSGTEVYIGESENLRQRMEHDYRYHPGMTNMRVRGMLLDHIAAGRSIHLAICRRVVLEIDGEPAPADPNSKQVRLLVENAALTLARHEGEQIHNL